MTIKTRFSFILFFPSFTFQKVLFTNNIKYWATFFITFLSWEDVVTKQNIRMNKLYLKTLICTFVMCVLIIGCNQIKENVIPSTSRELKGCVIKAVSDSFQVFIPGIYHFEVAKNDKLCDTNPTYEIISSDLPGAHFQHGRLKVNISKDDLAKSPLRIRYGLKEGGIIKSETNVIINFKG